MTRAGENEAKGSDSNDKIQRSAMPSVDKALRALLVLAEAGPEGMPLIEVAKKLGLNRSSLHVTLGALRFRDFVAQSPITGYYRLGSAVGYLSQSYLNSLDIRLTLRPAILRLADQINEVCHIAVLEGQEILYIEKIESRRAIQPGTRVGMRLPALTTAMGRAMVAYECPTFESFKIRFKNALTPRTKNAPKTLEEEWSRIVDARRMGFGVDNEENVEGLTAVAVAVLDDARPIAAVSAVSLASDKPDLQEQARLIRKALKPVLVKPLHLPMPEDLPASSGP
ncbi:IclR family transcriptional regulator [Martelella mediterranea]|uniref:IclR family transcriptional regulator n=1 Tax=Martelella mediterranea TaxID=293089 RepID=UPI001E3511CE|nr:IclR family transcriptional regulator [Martelella mediterranea]MCD1635805.1 IclR family transcriptional regulator [Martelella mediterranea]